MNISKRLETLQASPIRKLTPYANAAKKRGRQVYHLNIGQPDILTPPNVIEAITNIQFPVLEYGPSEGLASYREALPSYYEKHGIHLSPQDILITTGGSEAINFALLAICDPGDEIIVPEPYYTNYSSFAHMAGVTIVPITSRIEEGFALPSPAEFAEKITARTKGILICNPSNPTGKVYPAEDIEALVAIVKTHNLYLLADEVYREFTYDSMQHTSILHYEEIADRAIIMDSVSKRYSMCGARVGALITKNQPLLQGILKMGQARLCPPTIEQLAAQAALETPDSYGEAVIAEYKNRRDVVCSALDTMEGVVYSKPSGAFYVVAKLPVDDAEKFAIFLLEEFEDQGETVMFAPAAGFYMTPGLGKQEIRIAYVLKPEALSRAMELLAAGLKAYRERT